MTRQPAGFAAVADEAGLLRYLKLDNRAFNTDSVYQLQYGSELVYERQEPVEVPCMLDRPWTSFEFLPHRARSILFHQSGSNKLLYTTLPDAAKPSSSVLLFGSHTGRLPCFLARSSLHKRYRCSCNGYNFERLVHRLTYCVLPKLLCVPSAGLIACFSVSAAGRYVVSGSVVGAIKLWSLTEGVQLDMQETAHPAGVSALAFLEPAVVHRRALATTALSIESQIMA